MSEQEKQDVNEEAEESSVPSEGSVEAAAEEVEEVVEEQVEEEEVQPQYAQPSGESSRIAELVEEKNRLQRLLETTLTASANIPARSYDEDLTPEERQAKQREAELTNKLKQYENALGTLADRQDKMDVKQSRLGPMYNKYEDKVERLRDQKIAEGQWLKREEALAIVMAREGVTTLAPPNKKIVRQRVKPVGETKKATKSQITQTETLEDRLKGQTF